MAGRTAEQRFEALRRAREIRTARAELRRRIASGEIFAARVLLDPPSETHTWELTGLLESQQGWGPSRAQQFLAKHQISQIKPVGSLTERQRRVLAEALSRTASSAERERRILELLGTEGPLSPAAIALRLGAGAGQVKWSLTHLAGAGLVVGSGHGLARIYALSASERVAAR